MQFPVKHFPLILVVLLFGCGEATVVGLPGDTAGTLQSDIPDVVPAGQVKEEQILTPVVDDDPMPAAPKQFTVADVTDLVLVTGQSNALGAETAYDASLDSPHERVFAYTNDGWRRADLHQVWDQDWFPRGHPGSEPSNNVALHIGKHIANAEEGKVFGFILATAPGQGIQHWDANGEFFEQINRRVHDAINQMPQKSGIDGIFWHQGESDEGDPDYSHKLNLLIERFRTQSWYSEQSPFICGETAEFSVVNQQLMALNNDGDRSTGCVESDGLETFLDGYHFSAVGLRELGKRYAEKYLQLD